MQTIQNGGLQMFDMLLELNGENMYGQSIQSISQAMVSIPPGSRTTLKLRRSSTFVQQQLMVRQQADFQRQLAAQQQQYQQQQYQQQPGYGGGPVIYAVPQPAYGINAPGYQVRTRHTYRPYNNYSGSGFYGAYAMLEYDADMLRALACRWITMGSIPIVISIILMASVPSVWFFFLLLLIVGLINVGRGIFYLVKANELAELDRTQPIQAQAQAQTFSSPIVVQVQQQQQQQQQQHAVYGGPGQPTATAQAYVYPSSRA